MDAVSVTLDSNEMMKKWAQVGDEVSDDTVLTLEFLNKSIHQLKRNEIANAHNINQVFGRNTVKFPHYPTIFSVLSIYLINLIKILITKYLISSFTY